MQESIHNDCSVRIEASWCQTVTLMAIFNLRFTPINDSYNLSFDTSDNPLNDKFKLS